MRLIDADVLISEFRKEMDKSIFEGRSVQEVIDDTPTVDAVPVVRCMDCKWWTKQEKSIQGRCALAGIYPTGSWYCGNGERKDDETDRR